MAKYHIGDGHGDSKLNVDTVSPTTSTSEFDFGSNFDRAVTNARIVEFPPDIDLTSLAAEISRIRASLAVSSPLANPATMAQLDETEKAAKVGDRGTAAASLRNAGKVALEVAEKVSAEIASSFLKASMGLK
jgi:hypothetical protein